MVRLQSDALAVTGAGNNQDITAAAASALLCRLLPCMERVRALLQGLVWCLCCHFCSDAAAGMQAAVATATAVATAVAAHQPVSLPVVGGREEYSTTAAQMLTQAVPPLSPLPTPAPAPAPPPCRAPPQQTLRCPGRQAGGGENEAGPLPGVLQRGGQLQPAGVWNSMTADAGLAGLARCRHWVGAPSLHRLLLVAAGAGSWQLAAGWPASEGIMPLKQVPTLPADLRLRRREWHHPHQCDRPDEAAG